MARPMRFWGHLGAAAALALRPDTAASSATVARTTFFRNGNARRYTLAAARAAIAPRR